MGGEPLTALCIAGFPAGKLPLDVLTDIISGARERVHAAGAVIIGGHTIIDEELKFGLAVTGRVHQNSILRNSTARAGDLVVLTKPLGTGIIATAAKRGAASTGHEAEMIRSMIALNDHAARSALAVGATCATDVTGFGLAGHALNIARESSVTIRIHRSSVPRLGGVDPALAAGIRTGGAERNDSWLSDKVDWGSASADERALLVDPQTSGGLLVVMRPGLVPDYVSRVEGAVVVGECTARGGHFIEIVE